MLAILCEELGPVLREVPMPVCQPSQVRVRVSRCALNRVDLLMAQGATHGSSGGIGSVLGLEWAGVVDQVGAAVPSSIRVGQPVMGSGRGGFAEYVVADWGRVLPMPEGMGEMNQAAVLPIALQTMHDAMVTHGQIQAHKTVLVHGAASAMGMMALQIARCFGCTVVMGTSRDDQKLAALHSMGMPFGINSQRGAWPEQVAQITQGRGVDLAIDMLSGSTFNQLQSTMALEGRIINVGRLSGKTAAFDFNLHALKRITYVGVTFRTRTVEQVRDITQKMWGDFSGWLAAGELRLPVDQVFPLAEFQLALNRMQDNRHLGKIVLSVADL